MKKGNAIFAFTLKNKQGEIGSWYIDLKDKGEVAKGKAPKGKKADGQSPFIASGLPTSQRRSPSKLYTKLFLTIDTREGQALELLSDYGNIVTLSLSDEDFGQLVVGKKKAQQLFMSGKLKIAGDVMKATKMEPVLKKAQTKAKL